MSDIIEEIGDLIDEEDKGDIRTATRVIDMSDSGDAVDGDGLVSATHEVTVKDLVSVDEVVGVQVSTDSGDTYNQLVSITTGTTGTVIGANGSVDTDNKVTVSFKSTSGSDTAGVVASSDGDDLGSITHLRVVARGY